MTRSVCERETALLVAMRAGALDEGLRLHVAQCDCCQQTLRVAPLLLAYAEEIATTEVPSSAARVWRRAQQRRREIALRRASWVMLAMRTLGAVYVLGVMVWALRVLWQTQTAVARQAMLPLYRGTVPLGVSAALVLLVCGALALVALGRRQEVALL